MNHAEEQSAKRSSSVTLKTLFDRSSSSSRGWLIRVGRFEAVRARFERRRGRQFGVGRFAERTRHGADSQQILASVLRTADQRGLDATDVLVALLIAPRGSALDER